jgi:vancomycin resistance protein VanJ
VTSWPDLWRRAGAVLRNAGSGSPPAESRSRRAARSVVTWCSGLYAAAILVSWALLAVAADRWWPLTFLLFGPRWLLALPLVVLLPAAALLRRRLLWALFPIALVVIIPVMGFCVPFPLSFDQRKPQARIRVLTCNTDGSRLRAADLHQLLLETYPDVVALQEWDGHAEEEVFDRDHWQVRRGKGLCFASRHPIHDKETITDAPGWRDILARHDVETPAGVLHFFDVHLNTPREGLEAVLHERWRGIAELDANLAERQEESEIAGERVAQTPGMVLVAGDFNMPVDSLIYRNNWARFPDAFSSVGFGFGYTKFTRWWGIRIDHILAGPGWRCHRCWVGPDVGSDHRPVIADLDWVGPASNE